MRPPIWIAIIVSLLVVQTLRVDEGIADDSAGPAIHAVLAAHIGHARGWLDQNDLKSLAQSAGGLELLAEVLRSQSDDPAWQQATRAVIAMSKELRSAAAAGDPAGSRQALAELETAAANAAGLTPRGQPLPPPRSGPGIRPLMLLLDGVYADAKVANLTGSHARAKMNAQVLSELARVVSNSRSEEGWAEMSDDFREASLSAAGSTSSDPKAIRQLLRGISESCEACHNAR
jgi:hypothetical protein